MLGPVENERLNLIRHGAVVEVGVLRLGDQRSPGRRRLGASGARATRGRRSQLSPIRVSSLSPISSGEERPHAHPERVQFGDARHEPGHPAHLTEPGQSADDRNHRRRRGERGQPGT